MLRRNLRLSSMVTVGQNSPMPGGWSGRTGPKADENSRRAMPASRSARHDTGEALEAFCMTLSKANGAPLSSTFT